MKKNFLISDKRFKMRHIHINIYIYIYVNVPKYVKWQNYKKTYVENNQEASDSCICFHTIRKIS
jgi:hypothetical protein